jgi:hypothetical protein
VIQPWPGTPQKDPTSSSEASALSIDATPAAPEIVFTPVELASPKTGLFRYFAAIGEPFLDATLVCSAIVRINSSTPVVLKAKTTWLSH